MRLAHAFEVVEMTSILTAEDVVRELQPSAPLSTSAVGSVFD